MYTHILIRRGESLDFKFETVEEDLTGDTLVMVTGGEDWSDYITGDVDGYISLYIEDTSDLLTGEDHYYIKRNGNEIVFRGIVYISDLVS